MTDRGDRERECGEVERECVWREREEGQDTIQFSLLRWSDLIAVESWEGGKRRRREQKSAPAFFVMQNDDLSVCERAILS